MFVGPATALVGRLGPGEARAFAVPDAGMARSDVGGGGIDVWAGPDGAMEQNGPIDFGLWQAALSQGGLNYLATDAVVAAGWTREFTPELRASGNVSRPKGRTVVLVRAPVAAAAQAPLLLTARRDIVRDPFARGGNGAGSVVRFVLPAGTDPSKLVLQSPVGVIEFWQDGGWRPAICDGPACAVQNRLGGGPAIIFGCPPGALKCAAAQQAIAPAGFQAELTVPPAAVKDGIVYARTPGSVSIDQGVAFTLARSP